jgi:hypothetical protein
MVHHCTSGSTEKNLTFEKNCHRGRAQQVPEDELGRTTVLGFGGEL